VEILRAELAKAWAQIPFRWKGWSAADKLFASVMSNLVALAVIMLIMTVLISALDNGCEDAFHPMTTAQRIRCEEDWLVKHGLMTDSDRIAGPRGEQLGPL
jgi:hypothetical protein